MPVEPVVTRGSAVYLIFGLWVVHVLHALRFLLARWTAISALPNWTLSPSLALWLGTALPVIGGGAVLVLRRRSSPAIVLLAALGCELASQVIGRSFFKLTADLGVWFTVVSGYYLRRHYGLSIVQATPPRALPALHAEALGMLRSLVNVCLFVIGTLGIAVTSNLITRYFGTDLGQGTAWVQVAMMLYVAAGMASLILWPLFRSLVAIRLRIGRPEADTVA
jgi:hypothetical protein